MSKQGRYRCIHCGDFFDLSPADQEDMDEGFYNHTPDCCDECYDMMNHPVHEPCPSDADPGL